MRKKRYMMTHELSTILDRYERNTNIIMMINVSNVVQEVVYDKTEDILILTDDAEFVIAELLSDGYTEEEIVKVKY